MLADWVERMSEASFSTQSYGSCTVLAGKMDPT